MHRFFSIADSLAAAGLRWLIILLMAAMAVVVFLQVLFRYLFNVPLSWSEELSRFAFVWVSFLGAAFLVRGDQHLRVTAVESVAGTRIRAALRIVQYVGALLCTGMFLYGGIAILGNEWGQSSPATQLRMGYVYAVIPFAAALMLFWIVASAVREIRSGFRPPAPSAAKDQELPP